MISQTILQFAAKSFDFDTNTLTHIPRDCGKIKNEIYTFMKGGQKYLIKFEPNSAEYKDQLRETKAALDFNYYLAENHVSVSVPLKTVSGELVAFTPDGDENYYITASTWLDGKTWGYDGSNATLSFNWGKVMGSMHNAAKGYAPTNDVDVQKDIFNGYYWGSFFDKLKIYPSIYRIAQELQGEIAALPRDKDSFGVVHGDLHQGNFFVDGDQISIIDFGDSVYGWYVLDVAISLCHALWWDRKDEAGKDYTHSIIENFMKGYLSANQLSDFWLDKIPLFMKYRHLCMDPEKNGLGCSREEWTTNVENDILFEGFGLKDAQRIMNDAKSDMS